LSSLQAELSFEENVVFLNKNLRQKEKLKKIFRRQEKSFFFADLNLSCWRISFSVIHERRRRTSTSSKRREKKEELKLKDNIQDTGYEKKRKRRENKLEKLSKNKEKEELKLYSTEKNLDI
jgi:hypothetical protein